MPIVWDTSRVRVVQDDPKRDICDVYQRIAAQKDGSTPWSKRLIGVTREEAEADAKAYDASLSDPAADVRMYESKAEPQDAYTAKAPHTTDRECTVVDGVCTVKTCGAVHGDKCGDCAQQAFHLPTCRQVLEDKAQVPVVVGGGKL